MIEGGTVARKGKRKKSARWNRKGWLNAKKGRKKTVVMHAGMVAGLNGAGVEIVAGVDMAVGVSEAVVHSSSIRNLAHARSVHGYIVADLQQYANQPLDHAHPAPESQRFVVAVEVVAYVAQGYYNIAVVFDHATTKNQYADVAVHADAVAAASVPSVVVAALAVGSIGIGCVQLGEMSKQAKAGYAVNRYG